VTDLLGAILIIALFLATAAIPLAWHGGWRQGWLARDLELKSWVEKSSDG
jgi:hypothetical protein